MKHTFFGGRGGGREKLPCTVIIAFIRYYGCALFLVDFKDLKQSVKYILIIQTLHVKMIV